jgi:hypothetical protein
MQQGGIDGFPKMTEPGNGLSWLCSNFVSFCTPAEEAQGQAGKPEITGLEKFLSAEHGYLSFADSGLTCQMVMW